MTDKPHLSMTLYGNVTPETAAEATERFSALVNAVTDEALGEGHGLRWTIGAMRWMCDGCGTEAPERPADWVLVGRNDYCSACMLAFAQEPQA